MIARVPSFLRRFNFGSGWGTGNAAGDGEEEDEEEGEGEEEGEKDGEEGEGDWRVYDEDTLLESMHARRTASERELAGLVERSGNGSTKASDQLGLLFTPAE